MGVPNSQLTANFSAKYQLTTIFFFTNSRLTTTILVSYYSYSEYYSVITQIFFTSARHYCNWQLKSLLHLGQIVITFRTLLHLGSFITFRPSTPVGETYFKELTKV